MFSTRALGALRVAAALCHSLPEVRARIRHHDTVLAEIGSPVGHATDLRETVVLTPCQFRNAVAEAHREQRAGGRGSALHRTVGADPTIDIAPPPGGATRPGGLYRVPVHDRWVWAFATTLDAEVAYELGADVVADTVTALDVRALGIHPDRALQVNLAYAETNAPPGSADEAAIIDLLEALLARWTMHELLGAPLDGSEVRGRGRLG